MFTLEEVVASYLYDNSLVGEKPLMENLRKKFSIMENPPNITLELDYRIREVVTFLRELVHNGILYYNGTDNDVFNSEEYFVVMDKNLLKYYFNREE